MKISAISFGNKPQKTFEEIQNEQLAKLFKQYQKEPFEYARIDYFKTKQPKVTTYPRKNLFKNIINKLSKLITK